MARPLPFMCHVTENVNSFVKKFLRYMEKLFKISLLAALFGCFASALQGQEVMTLKDCMEYAVSNSTKMRIQQADTRDAQMERRSAILEAFTPSVSAGS